MMPAEIKAFKNRRVKPGGSLKYFFAFSLEKIPILMTEYFKT